MGFSFIVFLVILIVIIFSFTGVFDRPPDSWEWVSITLAGLGLAVCTPSVFQMLFGRPKLLTNYGRLIRNQERALIIFLKNPPLGENSFWRKFGVRRDTIASLSVNFRISEATKVIVPNIPARIYSDNDPTKTGSWRIALPPTLSWSTSIVVAMWDDTRKKAIILGDEVRELVELPANVYRIEIVFLVEGQAITEYREFIVGANGDDLVWIEPNHSTNHKRSFSK